MSLGQLQSLEGAIFKIASVLLDNPLGASLEGSQKPPLDLIITRKIHWKLFQYSLSKGKSID